ncbi:MAG TPA: signal peptide peptidase SppA [Verrucomicrobiae bacterium]|nr:signal peptide peptidase SppA [Verrucomicrobiae bacterium]
MDNSFSSPDAPPPPPPAPPIIAATPPPRPRKGRGWMVFAIILLVLLIFSIFGNFVQAISHALLGRNFNENFGGVTTEAGPRFDEVIVKDNDARNKIAIIPLEGIITSDTVDQSGNNMVDVIRAQLDRAKDDPRVKAVILKVDSPGGEVMASDQINRSVIKFQKESHKPVICSMGSLDASGGYYISVASRWIVANKLTLTGSIGVIMEGINYRGLMDKIGLYPMVFKSGKYKDMLSGMQETNEIPPEENTMVQALINETFQQFKDVVQAGRDAAHKANGTDGKALAADWEHYADGRVLSGQQALDLGFVDQLGDFDDAVDKAKEITGITNSNANLIEYRERYDISDLLSMFGQSSKAPNIKLDLGIKGPELQAGERYFLWLPPSE